VTDTLQVYLVGGAVRDKLLGLPVAERDWVVIGATAQHMLDLGYTPVGKDFPVFLHPRSKEEYALARTERKVAPGYTGFTFNADPGVTLEQDLLRRDLTINAMAEDAHGNLIDPYGGRDDLDSGLLRHVSPAFAEDPVRILRVARFAACLAHHGFQVAHGTNTLMRAMVDNGEADALVAERVWAELHKALGCRTPARFFGVLQDCGALQKLFLELAACVAPDSDPHGQPQLAVPVLEAAAGMSRQPAIRFAALVCDVDNAGGLPPEQLEAWCSRLRIPNQFRELAGKALVFRARVHAAMQSSAGEILDLLTGLDAFRRSEQLSGVVAVSAAEARSRDRTSRDYPPAQLLEQAWKSAASVKADTTGKSGKAIGEALRVARIAAIEHTLA